MLLQFGNKIAPLHHLSKQEILAPPPPFSVAPPILARALSSFVKISISSVGRAPRVPEYQVLLSLKASLVDLFGALASRDGATDHCGWAGVMCNPLRRSAVISVDLCNLNLSGVLPPNVGYLRSLLNFSIAANALVGPIPSDLSRIPNLCYLNLSNNIFNGSLPLALSRLHNLQVLDLYNNNNLTGILPVEVTEMPNLCHLHLGGNFFSNYLAVSGNELTGPIPSAIENLSRLHQLYVGYYNTFNGRILWEIGNLSALVRLDMANCEIS
ncbi:hypothetical protein Taro_021195 [Colocasia esculenta]|uniref:Leucine-rich repeat-containing N-terminal plant-type domain-containing protein n=1 Tax=Colocasia esculenta TaxID=4460 RepID=A0A843V0Q4_COLES|nr:hypothetical protein [Colocasia esculenta]